MSIQASNNEIIAQVTLALAEDIGPGDLSAILLPDTIVTARLICRESAIGCGQPWVDAAFRQCDPQVILQWHTTEGGSIAPNQMIATITGRARALLAAERTALNFYQLLSGTATLTHQYVQAIAGTHAQLLDTRKTIPGMRMAQKYAVLCGGGVNHRLGLYDRVLLKENHIRQAGSIQAILESAIAHDLPRPLQIEVETLGELTEALTHGADRVLLDNFSIEDCQRAVTQTQGRIPLEISGSITLENIGAFAQTGVDFISVGALTKHVRAIDLSLLF